MSSRKPCLGKHQRHDNELTPEGRQKCQRCGKLNPLGVSDRVRFFDWVDKNGPGGCWLWKGALKFDGYGLGVCDGVFGLAHRWCWKILRGPLPPRNFEFDHICRVRRCVNPDHLQIVTHQANIDRRKNAGKCKNGHDLALTGHTTKGGTRYCLPCKRVWWREKQRTKRLSSH